MHLTIFCNFLKQTKWQSSLLYSLIELCGGEKVGMFWTCGCEHSSHNHFSNFSGEQVIAMPCMSLRENVENMRCYLHLHCSSLKDTHRTQSAWRVIRKAVYGLKVFDLPWAWPFRTDINTFAFRRGQSTLEWINEFSLSTVSKHGNNGMVKDREINYG